MRITKTSLFLLAWLAVLLTGCASTPMSTKDSLLIPDTQVFPDGKKFLAQDKNSGQIIIKRDCCFTGSACSTRI